MRKTNKESTFVSSNISNTPYKVDIFLTKKPSLFFPPLKISHMRKYNPK